MIDLSNFHELMEKDVSRKEFLSYVGVALLSVVGVGSFLKNLQQPLSLNSIDKPGAKKVAGYGMSAYGR